MKVIICGAGQVGAQIASHLSLERNDITVIDNNAERITQLTNTLDISAVKWRKVFARFWVVLTDCVGKCKAPKNAIQHYETISVS